MAKTLNPELKRDGKVKIVSPRYGEVNDFSSVKNLIQKYNKTYTGTKDDWLISERKTPEIIGLTPEQKLKLAFYDNLNIHFGGDATNDKVPRDLTDKWDELTKWPAKFSGETIETAYNKYSEPKETHKKEDLKPTNLPNNWETELARIPNLEKRPDITNEEYQALKTRAEQGGTPTDYEKIKGDLKKWTDTFPNTETDFNKEPNNIKEDYLKFKNNQEKHTDYDLIKSEIDNWFISFPKVDFTDKGITPAKIRSEYDKPKESHKPEDLKPADYDKIKGDLGTWTGIFGTETAQSIKNKLDAKPTGTTLTADQQEAINNYSKVKADLEKWIIAFPTNLFKQTPAELRKEYDGLKSRLATAISNLQIEQGKNKTLTEDIEKLKAKLGNPLENLIEQKLKEVIITEEWNYPYLVRSLESFLDWKNSQDKERRILIYRYWNTIRKNIEWLKNRLGGILNE